MRSSENQVSNHEAKFLAKLNQCALFAETLSLCLERTGLRQINLAQRLFVEPATVHNWRTNKRLPDAVMVQRISAALGLSSPQQQMVSDAWRVTRRARELVPCVEEAGQTKNVAMVLALEEEFNKQLAQAKQQIQATKWDFLQKTVERSQRYDLDPDIWMYSGY